MFFLCFFFLLLHFWNSGVAVFISTLFYLFILFVMKTHTYKISQDIPALTGEAHVQRLSFPKSIQEVTLDGV